jgi:hypothetical protein
MAKNSQRYYHEALGDQLGELSEMLMRKHLDYGSKNLERFGLYGILIRMSDKMERLFNLQQLRRDPEVEETIEDTLDDIAGYAIQARLLLKNELSLPVKQKSEHN